MNFLLVNSISSKCQQFKEQMEKNKTSKHPTFDTNLGVTYSTYNFNFGYQL